MLEFFLNHPLPPGSWVALDGRRIWAAVYLLGSWLLVGAIVGLVQREQVGTDLTSAIASVIAGMIVVPTFGVVTLFCGATWQDTIIGMAMGSIAAIGLSSGSTIGPISLGAGHHILIGALLATTCRPMLAWFCLFSKNYIRPIVAYYTRSTLD